MTRLTDVKIRGVYGWTERPRCEAKDEHGEQCRADKGHEAHCFPRRVTTPSERLETLRAAVKEEKVALEPANRGGFVIQWTAREGLGELTVVMRPDGTLYIDSEGYSRKTLAELLAALLEQGALAHEPSPRR